MQLFSDQVSEWLRQLRLAQILRAIGFIELFRLIRHYITSPSVRMFLRQANFAPKDHGHVLSALRLILGDLGVIAATSIAACLMILTERTLPGTPRLSISRLTLRTNLSSYARWPRQFALGVLFGAGMLSLIMGVLSTLGDMKITIEATTSLALLKKQIVLGVTFALVGFAEEFSFRGYAQKAFSDGLGFWGASILTSLWFMSVHLQEGDPLVGSIGTFIIGLFFCVTLRVSGNLAFAAGFHSAWDYMESGVFGIGNSSFTFDGALARSMATGPIWLTGGIVGPEGSALYFVLIVGLLSAIARSNAFRFGETSPLRP